MDASGESQDDSFADPSFYETVEEPMQDDFPQAIEQRSPLREQDRFLPIANVAKIMKKAVPVNGKIAKESKECVQECVSEFISFITSEAAERCQHEKRKTVNGEDLLYAINNLGFDNYVEPLKKFLLKFREASKLDTSLLDETGMFNQAVNNTPMTAVILNIPSTPMTLQAANAGTATLTARARAAGSIVSDDVNHTTEAINIAHHQGQQHVILTTANPEGGKMEEDMKLSANTAILVPLSGHVALVNGSTITTVPANTEPSTIAST